MENLLHDRVCSGQMTLAEAQSLIATNWQAASAGGTTGEIIPAPPPPAAADTPAQGCCKLWGGKNPIRICGIDRVSSPGQP